MSNVDSTNQPIRELLHWVRAAAHPFVKQALETALPDAKARRAYQLSDGRATIDQIRIACQMSPNGVIELQQRCVALGLMEALPDKRRRRLFDLDDFDLAPPAAAPKGKPTNGKKTAKH